MYACRARLNTAAVMPSTAAETANSQKVGASQPPTMVSASTSEAATRARLSPTRLTSAPAGSAATSCPRPTSATRNAAIPTDAPSSRARSAMTGRIAPWPTAASTVGPKAGTAMRRSEKSVVVMGLPFFRRTRCPAEQVRRVGRFGL
jgi:hypothetical protein